MDLLRLSASSSSESVTTAPTVSKTKEDSENLVNKLYHHPISMPSCILVIGPITNGYLLILIKVLWRLPLRVLHYAFVEAIITLGEWARLAF